VAFYRDARDVSAEVHQVDDEAAEVTYREVPAVRALCSEHLRAFPEYGETRLRMCRQRFACACCEAAAPVGPNAAADRPGGLNQA
jgi:hypothetical protein